jgi:lysophospholipase L1-like esterase
MTSLADNTTQFLNIQSYKNNNLKKNIKLNFSSDDGHLSTFSGDKACNGIDALASDASSGFVTLNQSFNTVTFNAPVGVIIGDSIAEGHPNTDGRLHTSSGGVDLTKPNVPGQISYHLQQILNINVYDHGIGGQTADQVRARWNRDVLAQTDATLTPTSTLSYKPYFVILVIGINDIFGGRALADIENDVGFMIDSAIANNIRMAVFTIGPHTQMDSTKLSNVKAYNAWLKQKCSTLKEVTVIDFYAFANDPNNDGKPLAGLFADYVHPTKSTYQLLSNKIMQEVFFSGNIPTPTNIIISTQINPDLTSGTVSPPTSVVVNINNEMAYLCELPLKDIVSIPILSTGVLKTIAITILERSLGYGYLSEVSLSNYKTNEAYIRDMLVSRKTIAGIGVFKALVDDGTSTQTLTFANTSNLKRIDGVNVSQTTAGSNFVFNQYALISVTGSFAVGDYLMTSTSGNLTKATDLSTQNPVAKVIRTYGSYAFCKLL